MPTRVLILENDIRFATELADGLRSLGADASVVEDPSQGLQLATTEHPNLIVLAVELHKMNGFSVCSRIKKEPALASVPVVLVTSNSTDVTIEQHRQRPNHADDYVRKPIEVAALIDRLRQFVSLTPSARPSARPGGDEDFIIDDEVLELESRRPPSMRSRSSVIPADSDVSTFTDNAFDGIMTEAPASVAPNQGISTAPDTFVRRNPAPRRDSSPVSSPSAVPPSVAPNSESIRMRVRVLEDSLEEANTRIRELESSDLSAKEAELETLRRELDDVRAKLMVSGRTGTSSGSTAREVLDLREQLHKKEKELLDLRDRVTQRDKELLSLKDTALAFEREKADLSDRLDDIARQLAETQRHADAARSDKEAAAKRAEDAKRRIEKLTLQLEEKAAELDQQRGIYDAAQNEHATEKARWLEEHQAAEQRAAEDLRAAMARASAEINQQAEKSQRHMDEALAAAERQSQDRIQQAVAEARSAAESQLQRELDGLRNELSEDKACALAAQERETTARMHREREDALEQARNLHLEELQRKQTEHQRAVDEARAEYEGLLGNARAEREQLERQRDERIATLQQERDEHVAALQRAHGERLTTLQQERDEHIAALQRERDERVAAVQRERDERIAALQQERDERVAALQRELAERVATLQQELDETTKQLSYSSDRTTSLQRQLDHAKSKWSEDRVNIERIKDALAAALVQLEAIEQRPIDAS